MDSKVPLQPEGIDRPPPPPHGVLWLISLTVLSISFFACLALATLLSDGGAHLFSAQWPKVLFETSGGAVRHPIPVAVCVAFAINVIVWVPSAVARRETFFDLTGMVTFWAVVLTCVIATAVRNDLPATGWRYLPAALVLMWSLRLGVFLFLRVLRSPKGDQRFDELKSHPARFLIPWTLQAVWAFMTSMAAMVQITVPHGIGDAFDHQAAAFDVASAFGVVLWALGFALEVVADRQKSQFTAQPQNRGRFIHTGLWSLSRHPNYVGEILLWLGMFVLGIRAYSGTQWVCAASPLFVLVLIRFVSGVPQLETHADERWGQEVAYQEYKRTTPTLLPPPCPSFRSV